MTNPIVLFSLDKKNIHFKKVSGQVFDGFINVENGIYNFKSNDFFLPIEIKKVNTQKIISNYQSKSINIKSFISGKISILKKNNYFHIKEAKITTDGPGEISVSPKLSKGISLIKNDILEGKFNNYIFQKAYLDVVMDNENKQFAQIIFDEKENKTFTLDIYLNKTIEKLADIVQIAK